MYQVLLRGGQIQRTESIETLAAGKTSITYYAPRRTNQFELVVRAEPVKKEVSEQVLSVQELKRIPAPKTMRSRRCRTCRVWRVRRSVGSAGRLGIGTGGHSRLRRRWLPRIFHFAGFRSTINSEFVDELSFKPGAYGADFGRGLGGMIDVTTRSPKSDRIHGLGHARSHRRLGDARRPRHQNLYVAGGVRVSWISVFADL